MTIPSWTDGDNTNPVHASFFNAVAQAVYGALADVSNNPPTTSTQVLTNLGVIGSGATQGAGLIPFNSSLLYPSNTVGNQLLSILSSIASGASSGPNKSQFTLRNRLHNSQFMVAQRQTSQGIAGGSGIGYGAADRWYFYASGSTMIATLAQTLYQQNGFNYVAKIQRGAANAAVVPLVLAQGLTSFDSVPLQGQTVALSFYAKAGANFSGSGVNIALVSTTSVSEQSAANLAAGTWTSATNLISTTQAITTTLTRYTFTATVPANALQLGVTLGFTPTGTAGVDDSISITGIQLEAGGVSPYEYLPTELDLAICQRFFYQLYIDGVNFVRFGGYVQSGVGNAIIGQCSLPQAMRVSPTITTGSISYSNCSTLNLNLYLGRIVSVTVTGTANGYAYVTFNAYFSADV